MTKYSCARLLSAVTATAFSAEPTLRWTDWQHGQGPQRRFFRDELGAVVVTFALVAVACVLATGAAVDIGRWLSARSHTIKAADAAVLAGARALQLENGSESAAIDAANRYYAENVRTRLAVKRDAVSFKPAADKATFLAEGNAYIATPLLQLVGIDELPLLRTGDTENSVARLNAGNNAQKSLEMALAIDVSPAVGADIMAALKAAIGDLVDIVVWDDQSERTSRIALVPVAGDIRLPLDWLDSVRGVGLPSLAVATYACTRAGQPATCAATYRRTDCVAERTGPAAFTDAPPLAGGYAMADYVPSSTGAACAVPLADEVVALSASKPLLKSKIDGLQPGGGLAGHLGAAWAWYLLSPEWADIVPADSRAAAYGGDSVEKIAVLFSAGSYGTQYASLDGAGVRAGSLGVGAAVNGASASQTRNICQGMRARGLTVYTIAYDLGTNGETVDVLARCASSAGHAYVVTSAAGLIQAFRDIALKVAPLYLSH